MTTPEEFRACWISDAQMEVEDVAEGHRWVFTLGQNAAGERLISSAHQRAAHQDDIRATELAGRAWRFAEAKALREGRIDRPSAP